jgi:diadenosine tetraphosphatase ApaH/serine/threonine PP2A family protein phosphatase
VQWLASDSALGREVSRHSLPLLALFDDERQYLGKWGPHPAGFVSYMDDWRKRHPDSAPEIEFGPGGSPHQDVALHNELIHEMRLWYNSALNQASIVEVRALLESVLDDWVSDDTEDEEDE